MATHAFLKLTQGKLDYLRDVYVNMSYISHFHANGDDGTIIYFPLSIANEPAYVVVNESVENIAERIQRVLAL